MMKMKTYSCQSRHTYLALLVFAAVIVYGHAQYNGDIVLDSNGLVKVYAEGKWRSVCVSGDFTIQSQVLCRSFGQKFSYYSSRESYLPGTIRYLQCRGDENSLSACSNYYSSSYGCSYNKLHVQCEEDSTKAFCPFDNNMCGMVTEGTADYEWQRIRPSGLSGQSSPKHDHTTESNKGKYMLASAVSLPGRKAILKTKPFVGNMRRVSFYYHMFGRDMGSLNVYIKTNSSSRKSIVSISGNEGIGWKYLCLPVDKGYGHHEIIFEAVHGKGFDGDIAIDDMTISETDCSSRWNGSCDFESSTCGYDIQNWNSMNYGWRLLMNNTIKTTYSSSGNYLRFTYGYNHFTHSVMSPTIDIPNEKSRVEFRYYMTGTGTKELQVRFVEDGLKSRFTKTPYFWQDNEDHGSEWQYGCMDLPTSIRGEIKFTGMSKRYSTIGLDDLVVDKGYCRTGITNYMCTFDNPLLCEYEISCMNPNEYTWRRKKGATSSSYTGPDGDYSKQRNGYYMYADASYGDVNDTTSLKFPISNNTKGKYLTFAYHMYGYSVGQLSVVFKTKNMSIKRSTNEETVWTRKGNKANYWHKACLFIAKDVNEIIFVAVRGSSYQGDIAVDNISIAENGCPGPFDCDFEENGLCRYKVPYGRSFRWYISTEYSYTRNSNRYFRMYSYTNTENAKFEMYSPQAAVKGNSSVTFRYKLTGNMKDISLIKYDSYSRNISWSSNYNDIYESITACVDFPFSTEFGLIFQATTKSNSRWKTYIYLDDIKTHNETCKLGLTYHFCKFKEVHLCNFHVECPENTKYNWSRGSSSDYRRFPRHQRYSYEKEYYMYVDSLNGKPGDKTHLSFSNVTPAAGHSLHFDYYLHQGSGTLQVDLGTAKGKKRVFEEFSVVSSSLWQSACVSVPNEYVDIEFIATNGYGMGQYMGLTHVGFLPGECQARSISCDFSEGTCQYSNIDYYSRWKIIPSRNDTYQTNGFYMETSSSYYYAESKLASPTENITNSCVQIRYKIINKNCNLTIFNAFNKDIILSTVSDDTTQWRIAQTYIQHEAVKLVFLAKKLEYSGMCKVLLDYINITDNNCPQLECPAGTRKCKNNYCYSESKLCDRINDCSDGTDEMNCRTSISCEFSTKYYCGYKVVNGWELVLDNNTKSINVPGSMQIIGRKGKMISPFETLADSCVNIKFTTYSSLTGNFSVYSNHWNPDGTFSHDLVWDEYFFNEIDGNYEGQFQFAAGKGLFTFMADIKSGGLALDSVTVLNGTCPELNCSPNTYKCLDNTKCINKKNLCNNYWNCMNGGDEANCPKYFTCNFEDSNMCGFRSSPEKQWSIGTGMLANIPSLDHSEGTYEGQYIVSHSSGESKLSLPGITTEETFCFNFHYMFSGNGTVSIYDNDTFLMSLSKFDYDMWRGANITLPSGSHNIHFVYSNGKSTHGTIALDSVSIIRGRCSHKSCQTNEYSCNNNTTCYPRVAKCDGNVNCPNGEDEDNCSGKIRTYRLTLGRTFLSGRVEKRYGSRYIPICRNYLQSKTLNDICYELGANATTTQTSMIINVIGEYYSCYYSYYYGERCSLRNCINGCRCYTTYVTCSNTTCEDGMVRCHPGRNETNSSNVCIRKESVCDGEMDCKEGTDENSCASCAVGHWQCKNHKCIKKGLGCDGKKDCDDGSDEFHCLKYVNKTIQVYYNGSYKHICENNLNDKDIPNQLCSSVGRSNGTFGNSIDGVGVQFIKNPSGSDKGLIPGFKANSFGQCKYMVLECSEQVCGTRRKDLFEPNIQNGHDALPGEWPSAAQLYTGSTFTCTASVISKYYVLTAAHCVDTYYYSNYYVRVGSIKKGTGTLYRVNQVMKHEDYISYKYGFDLALLYVKSGITMTDDVQPICLPENPAPLERDYYVTGWGRDENGERVSTLKEAKNYLLDYSSCKKYYTFINKNVICGNNKEFYQPTCYGDSGGPLQALNDKGFWEVHGVTSFGRSGCKGTIAHPAAYSSVYHGIDWIRKYV